MPRIPYLDPAAASPPVAEALAALPLQLNVFGMVAHAQTAFRPWLRFGAALLTELELDPRLREVAILEVARLSGSRYEWVQHEAIALALGVDEAVVRAVEEGRLERLAVPERVIVDFVREVVRDVCAGDETLAAVRRDHGPRGVVELLLVIGHYMAVARLAETTGIEVDEPAQLAIVDAAAHDGAKA